MRRDWPLRKRRRRKSLDPDILGSKYVLLRRFTDRQHILMLVNDGIAHEHDTMVADLIDQV
jgi:hypothetical protein